jgi:protein gp37
MRQLDPSPGAVDHIWFGTSVSTQREWDVNVSKLLTVPAATHRWVSMEPMLEEIDICNKSNSLEVCGKVSRGEFVEWIVVGAQSGSAAKLMEFSWAEQVVAETKTVGIQVFYKQGPDEFGAPFVHAPSIFGGPHLDLPFWP